MCRTTALTPTSCTASSKASFGGVVVGQALWSLQGGNWLQACGAVLVGSALACIGIAGDARRKALRSNLWFAEWYAAQRLDHSGSE